MVQEETVRVQWKNEALREGTSTLTRIAITATSSRSEIERVSAIGLADVAQEPMEARQKIIQRRLQLKDNWSGVWTVCIFLCFSKMRGVVYPWKIPSKSRGLPVRFGHSKKRTKGHQTKQGLTNHADPLKRNVQYCSGKYKHFIIQLGSVCIASTII